MERTHFTLNAPAKRTTLAGREYLVAPVVMLVPGVLNGSKGALYYPPEELAANVDAWNGMPLTLYHPTDPAGNPASGRHPAIVDSHGLGTVFNARIRAADGALVGDGWFDILEVKRKDAGLQHHAKLYPRLTSGKQIELSTGLFTDNQPARPGAVHNGKPYQYIARRYRPDHLAILPDQQGACSLSDGCGVGAFTTNRISKYLDQAVSNAKGKGKLPSGGRWVTTSTGQVLFLHGGSLYAGKKVVAGKGASSATGKATAAKEAAAAKSHDVRGPDAKQGKHETSAKTTPGGSTGHSLTDTGKASKQLEAMEKIIKQRQKLLKQATDDKDKKAHAKDIATFEAVAAKLRKQLGHK